MRAVRANGVMRDGSDPSPFMGFIAEAIGKDSEPSAQLVEEQVSPQDVDQP